MVAKKKTAEADVKLDKHGRPIEDDEDLELGENVIIVDPEEAAEKFIKTNDGDEEEE